MATQLALFEDETIGDRQWSLIAHELSKRAVSAPSEYLAALYAAEAQRIYRNHPGLKGKAA